jgi:anti-sigma regulatory factor (Ser/Thr protein kinase)
MARIDLPAVTQWITAAASQHGEDLPTVVAERLAISRRSALNLLGRLVASQWLVREGTLRKPVYHPGALRQVVQRYPLEALQEDIPWQRDFAPFFDLPHSVARMAQHAFSELLNNAIDHSGGTAVTVSMRQTAMHVQLLVSDDGWGVFDRIQKNFAIDDPTVAMLELSKGKLTSLPQIHSGHGLFFTSRLADVFDLHANHLAFQFRGWDRRTWYRGKPMPRQGTSVYLAIALDTPRTLNAVLRAHSADGQGYGFETTQVPLQLMTGGATGLESRAQAKRVASRLHAFRRAEVDFSGISDVGHGFADELFRVFSRQHPATELVPLHMAPRVAEMIASVQRDMAARPA